MPKIKVEQSTRDRIKIIPFKNIFKTDSSFERKMIGKIDMLFSYILKYGVLQNNFDYLPQEMCDAADQYFDDNKGDPLEEFIHECIEFKEGCKIKREDFRQAFDEWSIGAKYPLNKDTHTRFTRELKRFDITSKESNNKVFYNNIQFIQEDNIFAL